MIDMVYRTLQERTAATQNDPTQRKFSTVHDGRKHYAIVRVYANGTTEMVANLTGTLRDTLPLATREADARNANLPVADRDFVSFAPYRIA